MYFYLPKMYTVVMLLPLNCVFYHILWQMLYQYMVADVEPCVVADVIAHTKQGGRC